MVHFAVNKRFSTEREKRYKDLTVREFTKAADVYESGHAGIYEMCKDDYPFIAGELAKEEYTDLLDCGCGTGPMISLLYEEDPARHPSDKLKTWNRLRGMMPSWEELHRKYGS